VKESKLVNAAMEAHARQQKLDKAKAIIEQLIDETSLQVVLDALATACKEKAEHVSTNWQDPALAGWWARRGHLIADVAYKNGLANT